MQLRPSRVPSSGRGFTLIELLVVISIIAILASLALPALNGAMNAAKKAQANAMISQIKVAVTGYNTEYGTWPTANTGNTETLPPTTLYSVLTATEGASPTFNTRQIVFMEFATKDTDSTLTGSTPSTPTMYVDPWDKKGTTQNYVVLVDGNFDNVIDGSQGGGPGPTNLNAGCAVWDKGPPLKKGVVQTDTTKFLRSW